MAEYEFWDSLPHGQLLKQYIEDKAGGTAPSASNDQTPTDQYYIDFADVRFTYFLVGQMVHWRVAGDGTLDESTPLPVGLRPTIRQDVAYVAEGVPTVLKILTTGYLNVESGSWGNGKVSGNYHTSDERPDPLSGTLA